MARLYWRNVGLGTRKGMDTMKQLRKTIRKILLENQRHYEKIVDMILTGDLAYINQALELALTMEYVTDLQHDEHPPGFSPYTRHVWRMNVDPEFEAAIERKYRIDFKSFLQIFYGMTSKPGEMKIQLYVDPNER